MTKDSSPLIITKVNGAMDSERENTIMNATKTDWTSAMDQIEETDNYTNLTNDSSVDNFTLKTIMETSVATSSHEIVLVFSFLFFTIGLAGIAGNLLVILSVLLNKKMRTSMTNLLITNLAVADLLIMVFGIPEIVQFIKNSGWSLGVVTCKINRFILVTSLYGSILTLVALSVERYIAIIHPIKAHIFCNKRRLVFVLGCIWPASWAAGLPTMLYNTVRVGDPSVQLSYCMIVFPNGHRNIFLIFKYIESILFYFIPLVLQVVLYTYISKHLFIGTDRLHRRVPVRDFNGASVERFSEALQARRGVVKMLILSVAVYFLSYSPNQVLLVLNTIAPRTFHENWSYLAFTMIISYVNSAANPIMYSIFSQNFRQCFKKFMCVASPCGKPEIRKTRNASNGATNSPRLWRHISMATASTHL